MDHISFYKHWEKVSLPFVAILRGITPKEAISVAQVLYDIGFTHLEIPLNSPEPYESIGLITDAFKGKLVVGAGTVLNVEQVKYVANVGGKIIVSPNTDMEVIHATRELNLISLPGVMTPSEAFSAIKAGASGIKLFPGEILSPHFLIALKAVLPNDVVCLPVGGIKADITQLKNYLQAGAKGFGLGGSLYKKDDSLEKVTQQAQAFADVWKNI